MSTQLTPPKPIQHSPSAGETPQVKGTAPSSGLSSSKQSKGKGFLIWMLLAALGGAAWYFHPYWLPQVQKVLLPPPADTAPKGPRVVTVTAQPITERDFNLYINGLGTVTAYNTVTIRSRVEGEVINVAFSEGQMVQAGDLLAEIDPRPYEMLRDQALAQIQRDEATLRLAEVTLSRQQELMKSQASTPQLVDQQIAQVEQTKAALQLDQAMLDNAKLQLAFSRITAPISGRIGLRLVDKGNMIQANSSQGIAVITQLEPISLTFTISQDEIPRVQRRIVESGALTVDAYDRDFRTKIETGTLTAIDNQVDATTGTLRLKATFENKEHLLFPNQFVNARLHVETIPNALLVPTSAIQRGSDKTYVYVLKPDNTVELRTVRTGPSEGAEISILEGVSRGEIVVTNGLDKLRPGAQVTVAGSQNAKSEPEKSGPPSPKPQAGSGKGEA
ncbi:efflux RND transporter periplasmic adaptor subunit [Planctomicrobium sp. SH527]|uniref:efflux RND transporter periplasmic adaptor subunit n=1 Tax=Planctomicrobium sp. SH527 TaxID=3448123 RepID=UPI003F5BFCFC